MKLLAGETKEKRLSINQLRQTVRCANEEAAGYLHTATRLQKEVDELQRQVKFLENHAEIRVRQTHQIEAWSKAVLPLEKDWKGPGS